MRCLLPSELLSPSQQGTSTQFGVKHCKPLPWAPHAQGSHLCRARHQGKLLCPMLLSPLQVQVMLSTEHGIRDASSSLHSSWLLFGVFASICLYPCVCLSAETSKTAVLGAKAAHSLEPGSFGAIHPPLPPLPSPPIIQDLPPASLFCLRSHIPVLCCAEAVVKAQVACKVLIVIVATTALFLGRCLKELRK